MNCEHVNVCTLDFFIEKKKFVVLFTAKKTVKIFCHLVVDIAAKTITIPILNSLSLTPKTLHRSSVYGYKISAKEHSKD